jgi:hypothetical protein
MNTYSINVKRDMRVTSEDINDIITAALEGGINYWCNEAEVVGEYLGEYASEQISKGGTIILHDAESEDTWELNLEKLLRGIELAIEEEYLADYEWYDADSIDTCQIDADVADAIIQFAIFEEIIFG